MAAAAAAEAPGSSRAAHHGGGGEAARAPAAGGGPAGGAGRTRTRRRRAAERSDAPARGRQQQALGREGRRREAVGPVRRGAGREAPPVPPGPCRARPSPPRRLPAPADRSGRRCPVPAARSPSRLGGPGVRRERRGRGALQAVAGLGAPGSSSSLSSPCLLPAAAGEGGFPVASSRYKGAALRLLNDAGAVFPTRYAFFLPLGIF